MKQYHKTSLAMLMAGTAALLLAVLIILIQLLPVYQRGEKLTQNSWYFDSQSDRSVLLAMGPYANLSSSIGLVRQLTLSNCNVLAVKLNTVTDSATAIKQAFFRLQDKTDGQGKILYLGQGYGGSLSEVVEASNEKLSAIILVAPRVEEIDHQTKLNIPLLMLGSTNDEKTSAASITDLYNSLTGEDIHSIGAMFKASKENISLVMQTSFVHQDLLSSSQITEQLFHWVNQSTNFTHVDILENNTQNTALIPQGTENLLKWMRVVLLVGVVLILLGAYRLFTIHTIDLSYTITPVRINKNFNFIGAKFGVVLAAIPVLLLFGWILNFIVPSIPVNDLAAVGIAAGIPACMYPLYLVGKAPATNGKMRFMKSQSTLSKSFLAVGIWTLFLLCGLFYRSAGVFYVGFLQNGVAFSSVTFLLCLFGFYIVLYEMNLMDAGKKSLPMKLIYQLLRFLPALLWCIVMLTLNHPSDIRLFVQNFVLLGVLTLFGRLIQIISGKVWLAALLMSFSFIYFYSPTILF